MDLSYLRLTDEEIEKYMWDCDLKGVADAQLAKALLEIHRWLKREADRTYSHVLELALAAGIPKEG